MLDLVNKTPFAAAILPALDKDGSELLVVVTKATYAVSRRLGTHVADEQAPVVLADVHHGEPGKSSVLYEAESAPREHGVAVVMIGSAHAPGAATASVDVELRVGPVRKTVRVFGPRCWTKKVGGLRPSSPTRFVSAKLVWELAFGGEDKSHADPSLHAFEPLNPVGVGFVAPRSTRDLDGQLLPQIEDPNALLETPADRPPPAGFGFVARSWQPRAALAGTYDAAWRAERAPLLPLDFDDRHFQAAPSGLVARSIAGGEVVSATGVLPGGRPFELALPRTAVEIEIVAGPRATTHRARIDTVVIEPDLERVCLTWRVAVPVRRKLLAIDRIRVREVAP